MLLVRQMQQRHCLLSALCAKSAKPAVTSSGVLIPQRHLKSSAPLKSENHGALWRIEKANSALAFPTLIVPFLYTTPLTDAFFCTVIVLHSHWGETYMYIQSLDQIQGPFLSFYEVILQFHTAENKNAPIFHRFKFGSYCKIPNSNLDWHMIHLIEVIVFLVYTA